jgi:glucose/arabinose dehydrogenase
VRRPPLLALVVVAFTACGSAPAGEAQTQPVTAAAAARGVKLTRIGTFVGPTYVAAAPGDPRRLFVVEQPGRIRVLRDGHVLRTPFLDIRAQVRSGGEQGLLGLAFAPDYATSGVVYVDYTDVNGDTRVVAYRRASAERADPRSARLVLFQRQPQPNHNGGQLAFGPDGLLYIGLGDGGAEGDPHGPIGNGQNLGTLLGKILRIEPRPSGGYHIPPSNPFVHRRGVRKEIYAYGLRNPWRFSFDRRTGAIAIGDVGQDTVEEVDWRPRGRAGGVNFGWRAWEGTRRYDPSLRIRGDVKPVLEYTHAGGNCSVTGGYVVRDPRLPGLAGRYVYGDFCRGELLSARLGLPRARERADLHLRVPMLSSFGEDDAGRIYAASLNGPVYRLDPP